jgi:hypothetical protein
MPFTIIKSLDGEERTLIVIIIIIIIIITIIQEVLFIV